MLHQQYYSEDIERVASMDLPWEQFEHKRVVVTGATGMTASMLIDVLMYRNMKYQADISIVAVSRSKERILRRFTDYLDDTHFRYHVQNLKMNTPEMGDIDIVFHGAGYTLPDAFENDPIGTVSSNVIGTHKLLSYASTHNARKIIYFSSVDIYGSNRGDVGRFTEDYCGYIDCNSVKVGFAESKRVGESLTRAYGNQYGMHVSIARFCKIYGPSMSLEDSKTITKYIRQGLYKKDIVLTGNREEIYSYCYAADAVAGLLLIAMKGEDKEAYNIADNREPLNSKLLAQKIAELTDTRVVEDSHIENLAQNNTSYANNYVMDAEKLLKLGWQPQIALSEGLKRTLSDLAKQ